MGCRPLVMGRADRRGLYRRRFQYVERIDTITTDEIIDILSSTLNNTFNKMKLRPRMLPSLKIHVSRIRFRIPKPSLQGTFVHHRCKEFHDNRQFAIHFRVEVWNTIQRRVS